MGRLWRSLAPLEREMALEQHLGGSANLGRKRACISLTAFDEGCKAHMDRGGFRGFVRALFAGISHSSTSLRNHCPIDRPNTLVQEP
jgi:hypothetical protein